MKLKLFFVLCLTLLIFSIVAVCHAQTNIPNESQWDYYVTNRPASTAGDIAKVAQDFGLNISVATVAKIYGALFVLSRVAMRYILKDPNSPLYKIATHIALQAPSTSTPPTAPKV